MSMGTPEPAANAELDDDYEEISVEITDDNTVLLYGSDWELELTPVEARQLAEALKEAADDAESETSETTEGEAAQ